MWKGGDGGDMAMMNGKGGGSCAKGMIISSKGKNGFGGMDAFGFKGGKDGGKSGKDGKGKGKGAMKISMGETVYTGRVKMFDVEKKRGYIVSEEVFSQSGQDVYVFEKVLSQSGGGPGDLVAFFLHWSASGQPQASAPILRIAGESAQEFALKGTYKPGTGEQGHGFLTCDATKDFFGRDVYVNKDLAAQLQPGQVVAFNAYLNRDRMPNVHNLEPCDAAWEPNPGDLSMTRTAESVSGGVASKGKGGCAKGMALGKDGGGKDGWGKGAMGPDLWDTLSGCSGGFNGGGGCGGGGCGGGCGGGWGGGWDDGWGKGGKMGMMKGGFDAWCKGGKDGGMCKGKSKGKPCGGGGGVLPTTPTGETFVGIIKSFNDKTGYGFIACDEVMAKYGGDCFCAKKFVGELGVGDMVEFDVGTTPDGKPQAIGIRATGGGVNASPGAGAGWSSPGQSQGEFIDFSSMNSGNKEQEDALAALQADLANLGDLAMEPMLKKPRMF